MIRFSTKCDDNEQYSVSHAQKKNTKQEQSKRGPLFVIWKSFMVCVRKNILFYEYFR